MIRNTKREVKEKWPKKWRGVCDVFKCGIVFKSGENVQNYEFEINLTCSNVPTKPSEKTIYINLADYPYTLKPQERKGCYIVDVELDVNEYIPN